MTGSAHTLILSKCRARIQAGFTSDPDLVISPVGLRQVLLEWKKLLENLSSRYIS